MKIYVAGSSRELERAEAAIAACRALGHKITVDWPAAMRANPADHELSPADQEHYARLDIRGVLEADLVWLLIPDRANPSAGAWFEAGVAHAAAMFSQKPRRTIASGVVGGYIFARVLDAVYETDAAALFDGIPCDDPKKADVLARNMSRVNARPWEFTIDDLKRQKPLPISSFVRASPLPRTCSKCGEHCVCP
jgi:hypothetical protein